MSPTRDDGSDRDEQACRAPAGPGQRGGGRASPGSLPPGGLPGLVSAGRWPADFERPLTPGQQFAVNEAAARLLDAPGVLTVPSPPTAGQVTLLRELTAVIVVARAERLAGLASPADAFGPPATALGPPTTTAFGPTGGDRRPPGLARHAVTPLNPALAGLEIVVAAADDGAAGNIAAAITGPRSIGARWRQAAAELGYFSATARRVHGEGAWAMVAVRLGDAAERQAFAGLFCLEAPGREDGCPGDLPGRPAGPPVSWDGARDEFLAAREKVSVLAAGRAEVAAARARLSDLRRDAAAAYAAITAAEDTLRSLAGQRVAAERSLRAAWHRYQAAVRALEAHARAKSGLRAWRPAWLGGGRERRARQGELGAVLGDCEATVSTAQRAVAEARAGFAAAVRARAEQAAVLRRLTAECAAAQEVIARGRQRPDGHLPGEPGFPGALRDAAAEDRGEPGALSDAAAEDRGEPGAPWADPELAAARTELFLAALALHKALVRAQPSRVRENLAALADFLGGDSGPDDPALLAAWQTFFLVVPVVCTTFASVPALFAGPEPAGWLVIDETGQAALQQAAGRPGGRSGP
jgi:hypothetical protein